MTQAFTSPITSRLKGGLFNPLEFNPYLLFDAQTSMLGELEAPTLDLDASDESTLDVITATRAGVATYTDLHGVIKTASADTVRVDWSLGYPAMLIEPSATNLLSYSTPDTNWPLNGATRIEDFASSPDGSQTATKITKVGNDANDRTRFDDVALSNGTQYSASVYLKNVDVQGHTTLGVRVAGGTLFRIQIDWSTHTVFNNNGATSNRFVHEVGDGWYRIGFSFTADGTNSDFEVDVDRSGAGATDTSSVLVWGAQVETGSVATSYIPTSGGSVAERTRNADDLVIDGTNFSDFYNGSEGTFYVEAVDRQATGSSHSYLGGQDTTRLFLYNYDTISSVITYDGANDYQIAGLVSNELFRAAVSYKTGVSPNPSVISISMNGTTISDQPYSDNFTSTNILKIGSGYTKVFSGHIRRILYWPTHSSSL